MEADDKTKRKGLTSRSKKRRKTIKKTLKKTTRSAPYSKKRKKKVGKGSIHSGKTRKRRRSNRRVKRKVNKRLKRRKRVNHPKRFASPAGSAPHSDPNRPDGYYVTTLDWIKASQLSPVNEYYKRFYAGDITHFFEAKGLDHPIDERFHARSVKSPEAFVAVVPDARLWSGFAYVISPDNKLLADVSFHWRPDIQSHPILTEWESFPLEYTGETVAVLTYLYSDCNYFHWMFDVLPRISLLRESGINIDRYVINNGFYSYQDETLAALGIPKEKRIDTHSRFHLKANKLIVPSVTSVYQFIGHPYPVVYPKWTSEFLRNELMLNRNIQASEQRQRIYISRSKAINQREVLNEDEILGLLSPYGFRSIKPESMTVDKQIELFSSAEVIIAPHGAGLTNIVFCREGTKIIELFGPDYMPAHYWMLSSHVNLDYYYLIGEKDQNQSEHTLAMNRNFRVNKERLLELLKFAGI